MIRTYQPGDLAAVKRLHRKSGLPPECMPQLHNPNFVVKLVAENGHGIAQAGFVKLTGEAFVLVDHEDGNAQERWTQIGDLIARGLAEAAEYGLDDVSAWLPPTLEKSFGPRLEALGWIKSPWRNYTALLR